MTRETKVGLIVGLAFIVVFAVILSHKGAQPRAASSTELGPIVDATPRQPVGARDTGTPGRRPGGGLNPKGGGELLSEKPAPNGATRLPDRADGRSSSSGAGTAAPIPLAGSRQEAGKPSSPEGYKPSVALPEMPGGQSSANRGLTPSLEVWLEDGPSKKPEALDTAGATARKAPPVPLPPAPEVKPPPSATDRPTPPAAPPSAGDSLPEPKPRIKQEHIVKKNDTITRIAQAAYGRATPKEINAILEANKKAVPNALALRVGTKIVIPELPADKFVDASFPPSAGGSPKAPAADSGNGAKGSAASTGEGSEGRSAPESAAAKDEKADGKASAKGGRDVKVAKDVKPGREGGSAEEKSANFRWHTVQENETLASIARKRLGNAERWREIADLNKGKLQDPLKIRVGERIKLPANGGGSSAGVGGLSKL